MTVRLFAIIWLLGLPGIAAVMWLVLPHLLAGRSLPVPMWVAQSASGAQSAVLLALAAFAGAALASKVHLSAPAISALITRSPVFTAIRPQIVPGIIGGLIGAAILWVSVVAAPPALAVAQEKVVMPAVARLLYGGITEEVLIRWGLMTFVVWILWRLTQGGVGLPAAAVVYVAIVISALVFGIAHLPGVVAIVGKLSLHDTAFIIVLNAAFGVVAGWLYWKFGLGSAILAHLLAHGVFLITHKLV